jgi:hypothetical protein
MLYHESAVIMKDWRKVCLAGHLDFEKRLWQTIFEEFAFIEQNPFL